MILRKYQEDAVEAGKTALTKHNNTVCVAPTGSGKTIMLSALFREMKPERALILQHRDELVTQNIGKFSIINPTKTVSICNADAKDFSGEAVFAMAQTLHRDNHLGKIPNDIELMVIDEAHHIAARTYLKIVEAVREANPSCAIAGFTATPSRGDRKGLGRIFNNVSVNISIAELINKGFLVPPSAYAFDLHDDELSEVRKTSSGDYDMDEVEGVLNTAASNREVVRQWMSHAGDRQTIIFCSTVNHAVDVCNAFTDKSVKADIITGETPMAIRKETLRQYEAREIQVLVNVFVLSEGFDSPITSCIVLLRPCSFKSTMIQMIGRGLRPAPFEDYPDVIKKDCVVLDFGASLRVHGDLFLDVDLSDKEKHDQLDYKICPSCLGEIPYRSKVCDLCGYEFKRDTNAAEKEIVENGVMVPLDLLLAESPFRWVPVFESDRLIIASGFNCFACVATPDDENFYAFGKDKDGKMRVLGVTGRVNAIAAADDFLRKIETSESAKKSRRWMQESCSPRQAELLKQLGHDVRHDILGTSNLNKITATALLNFAWNRNFIERTMNVVA